MIVKTLMISALLVSVQLSAQQPLRVGTWNERAVALAFYRSEIWSKVLKAKMAERESGKRANDAKKVEELEKWGKSQQELAHKQVFGNAPITNVVPYLQPGLQDIARAAGVQVIATGFIHLDAGVQTVDVTDKVLDWLKSDERTRKMVREFREKNPPPVDASAHVH